MKKTFIGVVLLSLMFVFFSNQAMAASAFAKAELDWSNLLIDGKAWNDPLSVLSFTSYSTYVQADAKNDIAGTVSNFANPPDWTTNNSITSTVPQVPLVNAVANSSFVGSYVYAGPTGTLNPEGWAYSSRYGVFDYNGSSPKTVTVTIPYHLKYILDATGSPDVYAYGFAQVYYKLARDSKGILPEGASGGDQYASDLALTGQLVTSDPANEKGTLSFQLTFYKGNSGTITLGTYSNASASAVPVPAAFWLLGSGLLGLIGIRRKTKA